MEAWMLQSAHVRKQRVVIPVARNGILKHKLVVETNLASSAPEITELADEIVAYLKAQRDRQR
jgi:hypothetical protein